MLHDPVRELRIRCEKLEAENSILRSKVAELSGIDDVPAVRRTFNLTNRQGRILALLLRRGDCSRNQIMEAIYDVDRLTQIEDPLLAVNSLMRHLRRRLATFNVPIHSVYSHGYRIDDDTRARCRALMAGAA